MRIDVSQTYVEMADAVQNAEDARILLAAAYFAYLSMPGQFGPVRTADEYSFEYDAYMDAVAALEGSRGYVASGVAYSYVGEL